MNFSLDLSPEDLVFAEHIFLYNTCPSCLVKIDYHESGVCGDDIPTDYLENLSHLVEFEVELNK